MFAGDMRSHFLFSLRTCSPALVWPCDLLLGQWAGPSCLPVGTCSLLAQPVLGPQALQLLLCALGMAPVPWGTGSCLPASPLLETGAWLSDVLRQQAASPGAAGHCAS